jgi:hypothetical protein
MTANQDIRCNRAYVWCLRGELLGARWVPHGSKCVPAAYELVSSCRRCAITWSAREDSSMSSTAGRTLPPSTRAQQHLVPLEANQLLALPRVPAKGLGRLWLAGRGPVAGVLPLARLSARAGRTDLVGGRILDGDMPGKARHRNVGVDLRPHVPGRSRPLRPQALMQETVRQQEEIGGSGEQDRLRRLVCVTRPAR